MIPVLLTIEGLYSYRTKQVIDFKKLNNARIFGIFGAVGSGKSTVLEAITLALFGQCERLDNRDNKNYNLMNLASNKLYVSFEFEQNEKKYQFNYGNKRNSKNHADVKSPERSAFVWENGFWTPLPSYNAEQIIGLSYDNFRRTIIIPQGKFQEFLQLNDADRTRMVKDMFSLERFEFYNKTEILFQQTQLELANYSGSLQELEQYSEEAELLLKKELAELKQKGSEARKKLESINSELELLNEAQRRDENLKTKLNIYLKVQEQIPELNLMTEKINQYKFVNENFSSDLHQLKKLNSILNENNAKLADFEKQIETQRHNLSELRNFHTHLNKNKKEQIVWFKEKTELEKLAEIKTLEPRISELKLKLEQSNFNLEKLNKIIEDSLLKESKFEKKSKELKSVIDQKEELQKWLHWFELKSRVKKQINESNSVFEKLKNQLDAIEKKQHELLLKFELEKTTDLSNEIAINQNLLSKILKDKEELLSLIGLQHYATQLKEGEPCPLCGSLNHPQIINGEEAQVALSTLETSYQQQKEKVEQLQLIEKKILTYKTEIQSLNIQINDIKVKLTELNGELEQLEKAKFAIEINDSEKAKKLLKACLDSESELQTLSHADSIRKQELKKIMADKEQEQIIQNELKLQFQSLQNRYESLNNSWEIIDPEKYNLMPANELLTFANNLKQQQLEIAEKLIQTENEIQKAEQEFAVLSGSQKTQLEQLESFKIEKQKLSQSINEKLMQSNFTSIEQVEKILENSIDINQLETQVNNLKIKIQKAKSDWEEAEQKAKEKPHHPEKWEAVKQSKVAQDELITQLLGEYRAKELNLKTLIEKREKATILREIVEKQKVRLAYLSDLKNLFKASGFVRFVSQVFLENLCKQADQRFKKLTRNQLSLELDDKLNFVVRDFLHNGQIRSVKTLSGGQTFQASLSLALALSDSFNRSNSNSEHFFFMDEGFGSLDQESLRIVFEALQSLKFENRIVGIISHLEELQKEIDTYITVSNSGENGSTINESWI
jgi:exonuclease SbcC